MLRRIGLQNFKCWRELDVELAPITLFFGVNSSGKTAILESLLMLKQTAAGFDPGQHINFGGRERDYVDLGSYQDMALGHSPDTDVGISLKWSTESDVHFFSNDREVETQRVSSVNYGVAWGIDQHIYIDKLRYDVDFVERQDEWVEVWRVTAGQYLVASSFASHDEEPEKVTSPQSCFLLPHTVIYQSKYGFCISSLRLDKEFRRLASKLHYIGPLRAHPQRYYLWTGVRPDIITPDGSNAIDALIASAKSDEHLVKNVAFGLGQLDIVDAFGVRTIDENKRLYEITATTGGVVSSLTDVGFGVSQVLPVIIMLMHAPQGSIVLLEQPELHLHPNAQAALADLLLFVAEERNLQLIVESHSEHIVRRLQRRIAEAAPAFATPENVKMYYCQPGQDGSTIEQVDLDRFGQISNWPERFFGEVSGDLHTMLKAALERRSQELESVGSGG